MKLRLDRGEKTVSEQSKQLTVGPLGQEVARFKITVPDVPGKHGIIAELKRRGASVVRSLWEFQVLP